MPQSLDRILLHFVFSTKGREPFLKDDFRDELHAYIGGIVSRLGGRLLRAGSVADHVHLLLAQPRSASVADLMREIKSGSSSWIKGRGPGLKRFAWQAGYGVFSISPGHRPALERYIDGQAEHHRTVTFQEEYRRLLRKCGVTWDERYVWD